MPPPAATPAHAALVMLMATGLAFGCSSPSPPPAAASAATLVDVDASAVAMRAGRKIPGLALAILQGDESILARGYGITDESTGTVVSGTTVFQLGSISKQFLAALALRLAEQGRLSLDAPVIRHLPEFARLPPDLRVRDLLNHTAGIRELFSIPEYLEGVEDLNRRAEELPDVLRQAPVDASPRSRWSYSNANYAILALVVERVTGSPYEHLLTTEFFRPLGLASLRQCTSLPAAHGEAAGHVLHGADIVPSAPENMHWIRGDGGLCGHAVDVARWTRLLATGRVVTPASYRAMSAPTRLQDGRLVDYGFGLSLVALDGRPKVAHNGAMLGFSASAAYYPDAELTVVVLANLGDVRTESIEREIARRLLGMAPPDLRARALPPEVRQRVVGRYDIGVFPVDVSDRGGQLWLEMPPPGPTSQLRYVGDGAFVCESDPEACRLTLSDDPQGGELRLYMGAMHWYGTRVP
jgi:D-alanyl-D-alanine carboxypeptidase